MRQTEQARDLPPAVVVGPRGEPVALILADLRTAEAYTAPVSLRVPPSAATRRPAVRPPTTRSPPMKTFACGDVIPGCSARFSASDEDGNFAQVAGHAAADHGSPTSPPHLVQAVRDRIVAI